MKFSDYVLRKRDRKEMSTGHVLYGENEPPEKQLENMWVIVNRRSGEALEEPRPDFSEFSKGDRMYPSMMKPEVKARWDRKNLEWEDSKANHAKLKRMVHARFMAENPDLPVVQGLRNTTYGNEISSEYESFIQRERARLSRQPQREPQSGTGETIADELQRDGVDISELGDEVLPFRIPESGTPFAILALNRDEGLRIESKALVSAESSHVMDYEYDEEGRLIKSGYNGQPVEMYQYNKNGQRIFSQVAGSTPLRMRYNEKGQLVHSGIAAYRYDEDGFLAEKHDAEGVTVYRYLHSGQLSEVLLPDGRHIKYRFNRDGLRTQKLINGGLRERYEWADMVTLTAVENVLGTVRYHYNEEGRVVALERCGKGYIVATDQLGSIFSVADLSGNNVQEVLYDSFGGKILDSNPDLSQPLGFAGGLYDPDTNLIHFGYREYDPTIGRFISPDPLGFEGGDVDLYGYCTDDPVNFMDRSGLAGSSEAGEDGEKQESESSRETGQIKDDRSFSGEFGDALLETAKGTGKALYKIGSLAVGATGEIAAEALDKAHKFYSPITHSETRDEALKFLQRRIEGKESSANAPVEMVKSTAKAAKESWNNMTEKERLKQERRDELASKLNSSSVTDLYSSNATLRKNRAAVIKASVEDKLKNYAEVQISTPDTVVTPAQFLIERANKLLRSRNR